VVIVIFAIIHQSLSHKKLSGIVDCDNYNHSSITLTSEVR